ncbi:hypothetical protein F4809DRAFT_573566 [Biscogniauxia mediterranea]|nr:hypothetical protein F4809DRAFT_573566 [Biscogniauxia mediterranea]
MVPVRKPGRPLSSCPHAPGKPCSCGGITAAIPRKGKCGCANSAQNTNGAPAKIKTEPLNPENPPLSPTKATSFRVQKATSKPPSRKQSYDPAALERMDPSTFNLMTHHGFSLSMDGEIERPDPMPSQSFLRNCVAPLPTGYEQASDFLQFGDYQTTIRLDTEVNPYFTHNGNLADLSPTVSSRNEASGRSSLASGRSSAPRHTPTSSSGSFSLEPPSGETTGSCCAPRRRSQTPATQPQSQLSTQFQTQTQPHDALNLLGFGPSVSSGGNGMVTPFTQAAGFNQQIYSAQFHQPATTYTYPPSYGTPFQPVQLSHWQQAMVGSALSTPSYANPPPLIDSNASSSNPFTVHQCACGPDCQCVGCTAHPFNEATQDYIRSAMDSQYGTTAAAEEYVKTISEARNSISDSIPTATLPPTGEDLSPISEAASSDTASGRGLEDQSLSAENFFFVQYDVEKIGLGCDGMSNSCPCGDDCACAGCMIHGKALLETSL